jgi:23S rRNA (cytidine1920-2'-O)/16S rRNA (cytidine1409-2'-O)-methyltransferase
MADKQRLDISLFERGLAPSREKARALVMAGEVTVNDQMVDKPGTRVAAGDVLAIKARPRFVSRGGEKLEAALDAFAIPAAARICADVGASTGGFTDCLLQRGAQRVYAIDVGYGQLDYRLRQDERVVVLERTNARYLERLPEPVTLVTIDASFISLQLLLPVVAGWSKAEADTVALIKPQFEAGRQQVGKGGVVRDSAVHRQVLADTLSFAHGAGFAICGLIASPLRGPAGNIEFLVWLRRGAPPVPEAAPIDSLIESALAAH